MCGGGDEFAEERLEPHCVIVFEAVNRFFYHAGEFGGGACVTEVKFLFVAVGTFEGDGDLAFERKAAAIAEWRFDRFDALFARAARPAEVRFGGGGFSRAANLAEIGIEEREEAGGRVCEE